MPRKPISPKQAKVIAKGKLDGKRTAEIAREAGVSVSTVSHPPLPVQGILRRAIEANQQRLAALHGRMLESLEEDLALRKDLSIGERRGLREEAIRVMVLADRVSGVIGPEVAASGAEGSAAGVQASEASAVSLAELLTAYNDVRKKQGETENAE